MSIEAELQEARIQTLNALADAVARGDTPVITRLARVIEAIDRDTQALELIHGRVSDYRGGAANGTAIKSSVVKQAHGNGASPEVKPRKLNRKMRGEDARKAFAEQHDMRHVSGTWYLSESRQITAIATATEHPNGGRWWLGVSPESGFETVVLLCQRAEDQLEFIIPLDEIPDSWAALSRSSDHVNLNVREQRDRYFLLVPYGEPLDITRFLGNFRPLH